jgi:hypothetical protein
MFHCVFRSLRCAKMAGAKGPDLLAPFPDRECLMPNAHLESLTARHARLEANLADESRRPSPDQSRVTRLKREKLKLKEEINRLH